MDAFPPLPERVDGQQWPPNIRAAYYLVLNTYTRGCHLLENAEVDPIRLKLSIEALLSDACPLLLALNDAPPDNGIPPDWLFLCTRQTTELIKALRESLKNAEGA